MKRTQRGMTLIGFIDRAGGGRLFVYMGMKLVPMYSEYYAVKRALRAWPSRTRRAANSDPAQIRDLFFRRLYISYADNVKQENVKIERRDAG